MLSHNQHPQYKINPILEKRFNGGTSDHALKMYQITLQNDNQKNVLKLKGLVHNMMMKAVGLEYGGQSTGKPYSNNPLFITETLGEYAERKIAQINGLKWVLNQYKLDYAFLQEADFMFPNEQDDPDLYTEKQKLSQLLLQAMTRTHYGITLSVPTSLASQQPLVTIYNKRTFTEDLGKEPLGMLYSRETQRFRAYCHYFIHLGTCLPVALINMHLGYNDDYQRRDILNESLKLTNILSIMGGDANHSPGDNMSQLFVSKTATTVCYKQDSQGQPLRSDNGEPILTLEGASGAPTNYDGICVYAPPEYRVGLEEHGGEKIFIKEDGTAVFQFNMPPTTSKLRFAARGEPYQNEKWHIKALNEKLGNSSTTEEQKNNCAERISTLLFNRKLRKNNSGQKILSTLDHYCKHKGITPTM